jgi:hypothetical protein
MTEQTLQTLTSSKALGEMAECLLACGCLVRFRANGRSMHPTIRDGEALTLAPIRQNELRTGDIVLSRQAGRLVAHRIVRLTKRRGAPSSVLLRGDSAASCDSPVAPSAVLAQVISVERDGRAIDLRLWRAKAAYFVRRSASRPRRWLGSTIRLTISLARICREDVPQKNFKSY